MIAAAMGCAGDVVPEILNDEVWADDGEAVLARIVRHQESLVAT